MYIAILGRQPALGIAELECLYRDVTWFSDQSAIVKAPSVELDRLGGSQKIGRIVTILPRGDWLQASRKLVQTYQTTWHNAQSKITLGISAYGFTATPREIQKTGIVLKQKLKAKGVRVRLIPNDTSALSTATSHHNKLGLSDNKIELIVVRGGSGTIVIAESIGSQNITAYARRDQGRPRRDAFVGMLPPKLAQIMINLTCSTEPEEPGILLDPFCGTGVILQEAALMGRAVYGTDLSDKMIDYSAQNLAWLANSHHITVMSRLEQADAMTHIWQPPITTVACETYLGQPFSAPPSPAKLSEVRNNCNHIIGQFLRNISRQLASGTPLCIAIPAWRAADGSLTHLPLVNQLEVFGFKRVNFTSIEPRDLIYYRDDQVVARQLLVLVKT